MKRKTYLVGSWLLCLLLLGLPLLAQEETPKEPQKNNDCRSLINPETLEELKSLRHCLRLKKYRQRTERRRTIVQKSHERSVQIVESKEAPYCIYGKNSKRCGVFTKSVKPKPPQ